MDYKDDFYENTFIKMTPKEWWAYFHKYLNWWVADEIKDMRRFNAQITQKEFADRMGTKQPSIARFEQGQENITISRLRKMAKVLGCVVEIRILPLGQAIEAELNKDRPKEPKFSVGFSSSTSNQYLDITLSP